MTDWIEKDGLPPALPKGKRRKKKVKEVQLSLPLDGCIAAKSAQAQAQALKSSEVHHERAQA
jgi:hypothetical protein